MLNSSHETRPHILIVGAFPPPGRKIFGGIITSCNALLDSSLPARASLTLVDTTQISNPPPSLGVRLLLASRRCLWYLRQFERRRPDVVLLFTAVGASVLEKGAMGWYARLRGVPALIFPRGGPLIASTRKSRIARWWVRAAFRGARGVLCQGPVWHDFAVEVLGFRPQDAPIVPNWTATPRLLTIGRNRSFSNGDGPVRLLFLGWVDREKGVVELFEACRQLLDSRKLELNVVGEGNASTLAREIAARNGMDPVVRFSGWLDPSGVEKALAEADVLVLPSWSEGFPNAMIEAMAARVAVVVSAVGNVPELVADGEQALLIQPRNVEALRQALERVIDDPGFRRRLADGGFRLAESEFGVEQATDRIMKAARDVIDRFGDQRAVAGSTR